MPSILPSTLNKIGSLYNELQCPHSTRRQQNRVCKELTRAIVERLMGTRVIELYDRIHNLSSDLQEYDPGEQGLVEINLARAKTELAAIEIARRSYNAPPLRSAEPT